MEHNLHDKRRTAGVLEPFPIILSRLDQIMAVRKWTAYVIVAVSQIQRRLVLHVPQHRVGAGLEQEVGDGDVLPPHCQMQGRAAVKHGSIHIGPPVEQKSHWCDVVHLHRQVKGRFATRSFLQENGRFCHNYARLLSCTDRHQNSRVIITKMIHGCRRRLICWDGDSNWEECLG